ncbi:MAG: histidinol-phosphate transaminase [Ahrensia sp.]|nr:histidinol-phosphate transaminase [Ahrensia sp.]
MIRPLPHIEAMRPYALADPLEPGTISLAQNESAFPPSPRAVAAGEQAVKQSLLYPDPDWTELRQAISDVRGLPVETLLCGTGSMELIGAVIGAHAGPGNTVVATQYAYAFVATACTQIGAAYAQAQERDLTVNVDSILARLTADTRLVFVANPGNPTGTAIPNTEIVRLRHALPEHVLLIVDQAYAEFLDEEQPPTEVFSLVDQGNTAVIRTFSKAYALAGARVGWGCFPRQTAQHLRKVLNPNNVSVVSQAMATAAMRDQKHMRQIVKKTAQIRDGFAQTARKLGITVRNSNTNFLLLQFDDPATADRVDQALRQNGLLLRAMGGYGLPDCLRITIGEQSIMNRVSDVLKEAMR